MVQHLHVPELQWSGITDGTRCIRFTKHIEDFNFVMESVLSSVNLHACEHQHSGEPGDMRTAKDAENRYTEVKCKFSNLSFAFIRTDLQRSNHPPQKVYDGAPDRTNLCSYIKSHWQALVGAAITYGCVKSPSESSVR